MYGLICGIFFFTLVTMFLVLSVITYAVIQIYDKKVSDKKAKQEAEIREKILKELDNEKKNG